MKGPLDRGSKGFRPDPAEVDYKPAISLLDVASAPEADIHLGPDSGRLAADRLKGPVGAL